MPQSQLVQNDRRTILGWCMYDWANSAYGTTTLVGILPILFASVIVPEDGTTIFGVTFKADALWGFAVAGSAILAFIAAPVLGAIADYTAAKKRFLLFFAYLGVLFTSLLWFSDAGDVLQTMLVFMIAQFAFVSANIFYDAYLPTLVSSDRLDATSSKGYAFGYIGGGLQFIISLVLVTWHDVFGLDQATAGKLAIVTSALWWGGFTLITAYTLPETKPLERPPEEVQQGARSVALLRVGFRRTLQTTRKIRRFKQIVLFLFAYFLYNDGIQTIFFMANIYATKELKLEASFLLLTLLAVQAVASIGAFVFGRIAIRLGAKRTVLLTLVLWTGIATYAYFMSSRWEFFALALGVGLVQGGTQALSRSLYSAIIPVETSAEFFGFYTVFSKFSAILGPLMFSLTSYFTGSLRLSILSLVVFFAIGFVLLALVDLEKARAQRSQIAEM
jgi:UMF1 family MFS transporter